ncbi:olfactory receptor 5B12-like [Echinops telfairi]|uniref:Olfactory receptor n=1 Tax=Echinops telfairi TaxID=9371 RepID=A0ABM0J566_ECHTE|nr:olfactory receptor 5B12-like [Echinops telfairi]
MENNSEATEFILVGLTSDPKLQIPLFITFLIIYFLTLVWNLGMILLVLLDSRLHTPMYLFLSNLSLADIGYSSAVTPRVMTGLLTGVHVISFSDCATHFFFFGFFAIIESNLLVVMAYDRYAAVCRPLHYNTLVTTKVCAFLCLGCYVLALLDECIHTWNIFRLSFCRSNVIDHFFCDIPPLMAITCSDIHGAEIITFFIVGCNAFFSLTVILSSYVLIFATILRMRSAEGRKRPFSPCAPPLTVVSSLYGTITFAYLKPSSGHSMDLDKLASMFYSIVLPMLNPLVYSVRNNEVKSAFIKVIGKAKSSIGFFF